MVGVAGIKLQLHVTKKFEMGIFSYHISHLRLERKRK